MFCWQLALSRDRSGAKVAGGRVACSGLRPGETKVGCSSICPAMEKKRERRTLEAFVGVGNGELLVLMPEENGQKEREGENWLSKHPTLEQLSHTPESPITYGGQ